jgi:hypothetical protein
VIDRFRRASANWRLNLLVEHIMDSKVHSLLGGAITLWAERDGPIMLKAIDKYASAEHRGWIS